MWKQALMRHQPIDKSVTYDLLQCSFSYIRTLKQLAMDEASTFSLASKVFQDVYMDDENGCNKISILLATINASCKYAGNMWNETT
ncbi:hypothetical protein TNIN_328931 [Trichonephila inaurata madagascariensis]|uniref:Uncharacterized protein n=1 Tax=Trichonephila inaurata madagascariensis TaxID=2747483 RepID=A0A8X6WVG0_9ARAC|nr:hypothetical protein TNIN_328931 [Trichonephila inaurata madagascariensis]